MVPNKGNCDKPKNALFKLSPSCTLPNPQRGFIQNKQRSDANDSVSHHDVINRNLFAEKLAKNYD